MKVGYGKREAGKGLSLSHDYGFCPGKKLGLDQKDKNQ
jgi:hypothetical protein